MNKPTKTTGVTLAHFLRWAKQGKTAEFIDIQIGEYGLAEDLFRYLAQRFAYFEQRRERWLKDHPECR